MFNLAHGCVMRKGLIQCWLQQCDAVTIKCSVSADDVVIIGL